MQAPDSSGCAPRSPAATGSADFPSTRCSCLQQSLPPACSGKGRCRGASRPERGMGHSTSGCLPSQTFCSALLGRLLLRGRGHSSLSSSAGTPVCVASPRDGGGARGWGGPAGCFLGPLRCEGEALQGVGRLRTAGVWSLQGSAALAAPAGAKVSLDHSWGVGLLTADAVVETLPNSIERWGPGRPAQSPWQNSSQSEAARVKSC